MERKMPKWIAAMWGALTAAYAVWMIFIMPKYVLGNYETMPEEMCIDGKVFPNMTGMAGVHWLYPLWVIASIAFLLFFVYLIRTCLYGEKQTKGMTAAAKIILIVGGVYVIGYGFLGDESFLDKLRYVTVSMIGLEYPWLFKLWGLSGSLSLFMNTLYCYRKFDYRNKAGIIAGSIATAAILVTVNIPSVGADPAAWFPRPRMIGHWAGALIFAFGCAAPLVMFLISRAVRLKGKFTVTAVAFGLVLGLMLVLLITVGKSAMIESLPIAAAYILLYLLNFTHVYDKKAPKTA